MAETTVEPVLVPESQTTPAPAAKPSYIWGVGRRKSAVARVRVAPGNGRIEVNGRSLNDYFTFERDRKAIFGPLEVTNTGGKLDIWVNADGGGVTSQSGALILGLARSLMKYDPTTSPALRGAGFLTRDSRMKERKKYGQRGARRRFQFSKR